VFPADTLVDTIHNVDRKDSIFGIDISHYTPSNLPFAQLASQNIHYVYAKATQGAAFKDPKFAQFWDAMGKLPDNEKVFRGAYHFLSASDDPELQARRFVAFLNLHGGLKADDLPPVMDLEWDKASANAGDRWGKLKATAIESRALLFLQTVEQLTGRTPIIYTARSWWRSVGIPDADIQKFSQYPIWIADYSKSALAVEVPAVPNKARPTLWQFSESAKLSGGFSAGLDANIFYGSETDFLSTFLGQK
jgi:lysozyme